MAGRALVLGGGGITGVAWEVGILAGLRAAGVDLTTADLIVGTSAGAIVGAQIATGCDIDDLYERELAGPGGERRTAVGLRTGGRLLWTALTHRRPERFGAALGRFALAARTETEAQRRPAIANRLPVHTWPQRRLLVTAVDAASGGFRAFDRESGVDLVDAVGASCAVPGVWPPVTIDGRRYIDGGMRSGANADLAEGYERVVVIAPMTAGFGPIPSVAGQVRRLRRQARVVVVSMNPAAYRIARRGTLDPALRAPAARAGRTQGESAARTVHAIWSDGPWVEPDLTGHQPEADVPSVDG